MSTSFLQFEGHSPYFRLLLDESGLRPRNSDIAPLKRGQRDVAAVNVVENRRDLHSTSSTQDRTAYLGHVTLPCSTQRHDTFSLAGSALPPNVLWPSSVISLHILQETLDVTGTRFWNPCTPFRPSFPELLLVHRVETLPQG